MMQIDDYIVVEREEEWGVRYTQDGIVPQEFVSGCKSPEEARKRARKLNGHVVKRAIYTTSWEPDLEAA